MLRKWIIASMLAHCVAFGQNSEPKISFDAASVKPSDPAGGPFARTMGGPGTNDPGRIRYSNTSLKSLLLVAYAVNDFQVEGPAWMDTQCFDIQATMPPGTTRGQLQVMLRNLLVDRFKIALHRVTKDVPAYTLVVGKGGATMTQSPSAATAPPESGPPPQIERDRDGFPKLPPGGAPGMLQFVVQNRGRVVGRQQTIAELATRLSYLLSRPVADGTSLAGKYDFALTFASEGTALSRPIGPPLPAAGGDASAAETPPDLLSAVQSQLGLRLEPRKARMDVIVIDHAGKVPVAN